MDVEPERFWWNGRRVLVTGHTGFKGAWLALWLADLGAEVTGLSPCRPTQRRALFEAGRRRRRPSNRPARDIRDADAGRRASSAARAGGRAPPRRPAARARARSWTPARDLRHQRAWARSTCSRPCAQTDGVARRRRRHLRQGLRQPRVGGALSRGRRARRPRPLLGVARARRDRHRAPIGAVVLRASRRCRGRHGARRQRHRRRRLGRRTGWCPTSCAPRRAGAAGRRCATPAPRAPGSMCSTRSAATSTLAQAPVRRPATAADGLELRPAPTAMRAPVAVAVERLDAAVARRPASARRPRASIRHEARFLAVDSSRARATRSAGRRAGRSSRPLESTVDWYRRHRDGADLRAVTMTQTGRVQRRAAHAGRIAMTDARLPLLRRAARPRPSSTSACRRWPTPIVRAERARRDGAGLSAARAGLRQLLPGAGRASSSRRSAIFGDYAYFSSYSRAGWSTAGATPSAMTERFGLDGRSRVVEIASNDGYLLQYFVGSAAFPVLGDRAGGQRRRRRPRPTGVADGGALLRRRDRAGAARARAARPTCCSPTTCWRMCPTSTTSSAGMTVAAEARRGHHHRVPAPAAPDRREPVRHDLPRALLVPVASRRWSACFAAHGLRAVRRRAAADPRRVAAPLRLPRRRRRRRCVRARRSRRVPGGLLPRRGRARRAGIVLDAHDLAAVAARRARVGISETPMHRRRCPCHPHRCRPHRRRSSRRRRSPRRQRSPRSQRWGRRPRRWSPPRRHRPPSRGRARPTTCTRRRRAPR